MFLASQDNYWLTKPKLVQGMKIPLVHQLRGLNDIRHKIVEFSLFMQVSCLGQNNSIWFMAFKTARNSFIKIVPRGGKKARARVTSIQTKPFRFAGWPCVLCPRGIKIIVLKMYSGIFLFRKKPFRIYNLHLLKLRDFGRTIQSIGFKYCCANGSSSLCYQ